jgi:hypothetical protein
MMAQLKTLQFEVIAIETSKLIIESNTTYRKYKKSAHMSLLDHPISQPSLEISSTWTPVITAEVKELQLRQM